MTHSRCWNAKSRLRTSREEGAGLGQLTRAFHPDGSIRFDKLTEMRVQYPRELGELSWSTIYQRPDLQIRTIVLMTRDLYRHYEQSSSSTLEALAFADAAYNGGRGGVDRERRACRIDSSCDYTKWFGHVERYCLKSKKALYGNRSACDINRHHVKDVVLIRANKYQKYFWY